MNPPVPGPSDVGRGNLGLDKAKNVWTRAKMGEKCSLQNFYFWLSKPHKRLVINYEEGLEKGKIVGPKLLTPPPPSQDGCKTVCTPSPFIG